MKKTLHTLDIIALSLTFALLLTACGRTAGQESPAPAAGTQVTASPAPEREAVRQDGERFEGTILLEGMEETVRYEHIRNEALGFEMDYDYESFKRITDADCERFVSVWDDPRRPENYLEVTRSDLDAEAYAASAIEALSREYDITRDSRQLACAGTCIYIEASVIRNTNNMAEHLQSLYIIPAPDGCRVAAAHSYITESEGFFRRFSYMVDSLSVIG